MYKGYVNADYTIQFFHEIGNNGVAIGVRSGIKMILLRLWCGIMRMRTEFRHFIGAHIRMKNDRL